MTTLSTRPLRVLFAVQGEGRGHMTQALALADRLRARGHTLAGVVVGASTRRAVPAFFRDAIGAPVTLVASPTFVSGRDGRIRVGATAWRTARDLLRIGPHLDTLDAAFDRARPDVVVNFYEGLAGLHAALRPHGIPIVAVAHQFMTGHPAYPLAPGQPVQRAGLHAYTRLAGWGASTRLALSLTPAPDLPDRRVRVVPPLLRSRLFRLADRGHDGPLLVYLMEPAFAPALAAWSDRHPEVAIDCFSDVPPHAHSPALTFHGLCGDRFLACMASARGVVSTAGFESVAEAMWLGKPALLVPAPNHYEQRGNARDAVAAGAGVTADALDLDRLLPLLDAPRPDPAPFRSWVAQAGRQIVGAVEGAAPPSPSRSLRRVPSAGSWSPARRSPSYAA